MIYDFSDIRKNKMVLLFSGGYDSTSVLLDMVESGCRYIECVYVKISNNPDQTKYELKACKKILKYIKKKYGYKVPFKVVSTFEIKYIDNILYSYPVLLFVPAAQVFDPDTKYVVSGFLQNSDIWHVYKQVEDMIDSVNSIFRCERYSNQRVNTKLFNPYEFRKKYEILLNLSRHKKLMKKCVTCCSPRKVDGKYVNCGECIKCIEHQNELEVIE